MFSNYLKIAFRNLTRHKVYSLINLSGFSVGMACFILIMLYIQFECSYDRFHKNAKHICRILSEDQEDNYVEADAPFRLGPELLEEYPEVEQYTRFYNFWGPTVVSCGQKTFREANFIYSDPAVTHIFSFDFIKGNPQSALQTPKSIIISQTAARKYFCENDPIGKVLTIDHQYEMEVKGVYKDFPQNSHLHFDFIAFEPQRVRMFGSTLEEWHFINFKTYLLLVKGSSPEALEKRLPDFIERHIGKGETSNYKFMLQPLTDIYLHSSHLKWKDLYSGDIKTIYILIAIAILILLIASFNYINLSTARSTIRAKEVGIRKVVGAHRTQLIKQFLGESLILTFLAMILALAYVEIVLPYFNRLVDRNLHLNFTKDWSFLVGIIGVTLIIGLISGIYPAFFLALFDPVQVIRGKVYSNLKNANFRTVFVILQFGISVALIICTITVKMQLQYLTNKNLGFNKEHLIAVNIFDDRIKNNYQPLRTAMLQNPRILDVSSASSVPPDHYHYSRVQPEGAKENESLGAKYFFVDHNFINMLGIDLVKGRSFSKDFSTDIKEAVIINETAAKELGWNSPIGKKLHLWWNNKTCIVIGVVKDIHFKSLHEKIEPTVFTLDSSNRYVMVVRIKPENIQNTLAFMKTKWQQFNPEWPFNYHFVDEAFDSLYRTEQRLGKIISSFSILAIFIACLGLFGLASYTTTQRTKEIGMRKVLGASISGIVVLLTKEFVRLVVVANLIAWPFAYYAINRWLQNFAYRIHISWWTFLLAGALALVIALLTMSYQAIRAATANPVEALKYE